MTGLAKSHRGARRMGFPIEGFSLFQSLLLAFAAAFLAFFATTCAAIFALLAWNVFGDHAVSYVDSYLYVGLPAGVVMLVIALPSLLVLWAKGRTRR